MLQPILYTHDTAATLDRLIDEMQPDKVVLLTDDTTRKLCLPRINMSRHAANAQVVSIRPTDVNKTLQTLAEVWTALGGAGASRKSLLVNLGGGMVTDLGALRRPRSSAAYGLSTFPLPCFQWLMLRWG